MSVLSSEPRAHRTLRLWDWGIAYMAAWLAPLALGLLMIVFHMLVSTALAGTGAPMFRMASYFLATALTISPAFTWIGLSLSVPIVLGLLMRGWFGWLPAILAGAASGTMATALMGGLGSAIGPAFGAGAGLVFWLTLHWRRPDLV